MPIRFRKSFKIAPGIRINLSKSGLSTTIGKRGASVNLSKRGARVTTGIPGSGISLSQLLGGKSQKESISPQLSQPPDPPPQQPSNKETRTRIKIPLPFLIGTGAIAMICQIFICLSSVSGIISPSSSTATPTIDMVAVQMTAFADAWNSLTQTAQASITDTPLPTATSPSTDTPIPTFTYSPMPTSTLVVFPTVTTFFQVLPGNQSPTNPPAGQSAVCSCAGNFLNCSDFGGSWSAAQACYTYCIAQGAGDIHRLDANNDGSACDSLR